MRKKINIVFVVLSLVAITFIGCSNEGKKVREINISVAASLLEPINKIVEIYENDNNVKININSGGSGTLKRQISEGADVGLFFSANEKYIDQLIDEGLVRKEEKRNPVSNSLVVIKYNAPKEEINNIEYLVNLNEKIAIGEINTVPAGEYAKESLINMGIWDDIEDNIIYCKDVTSVKTYVERGEIDYGFIYKSDAINLKDSSIMAEVDDKLHTPITYALATIKDYKYEDDCNKLIDIINSSQGQEIFKEYGFNVREQR